MKLFHVVRRLCRRDRCETFDGRAVGHPVHNEVFDLFELAARRQRVLEQQSVQMQEQAGVQRTPLFLIQVVERRTVSGELLLTSIAKSLRLSRDDLCCPSAIGHDDTFDRGRSLDARDARARRQTREQGRQLVPV